MRKRLFQELKERSTNLLDILKKTDLRLGVTDAFTTAAARAVVDRSEVQRRCFLCLYSLGTNMGQKRVGNGVTYKELLHTTPSIERSASALRCVGNDAAAAFGGEVGTSQLLEELELGRAFSVCDKATP